MIPVSCAKGTSAGPVAASRAWGCPAYNEGYSCPKPGMAMPALQRGM
ncbi:MAG TPA: hypothetical protein VE136_16090 [Anaerolineales bacterium]|nr:hypothetical protein [Anaerolineales bacterium]